MILAGIVVRADGRRIEKPGDQLGAEDELRIKGEVLPFVSRGGLKLQGALDSFAIDPTGWVCLDVGASTGGFTDCLLQRGAAKVFAVDVGYGQIDWKLRQDPRVVVIERANIRHLDPAQVTEPCHMMVVDVSFISLRLVLPAAIRFLAPGARLVALVKPQFEVGRECIGKGGIVRNPEARARALSDVERYAQENGFGGLASMESPIVGAKGNREYLLTGVWHGTPSGSI